MQAELLALVAERRGHFQMESGYHANSWSTLNTNNAAADLEADR